MISMARIAVNSAAKMVYSASLRMYSYWVNCRLLSKMSSRYRASLDGLIVVQISRLRHIARRSMFWIVDRSMSTGR
jgi:hypothetical protein